MVMIMKRRKLDLFMSLSRQKSVQVLILLAILYIVLVTFEAPFVFRAVTQEGFNGIDNGFLSSKFSSILESEENLKAKDSLNRPLDFPFRVSNDSKPDRSIKEFIIPLSSLKFDANIVNSNHTDGSLGILKLAKEAYEIGGKLWEELKSIDFENQKNPHEESSGNNKTTVEEACPPSIIISGDEFRDKNQGLLVLPCGLTLGSHVTVIAKPKEAHPEKETKISLLKEGQYVMVSQFMMELQGLKTVDGEDPPRILHFNPRLKGDWSGKPVIEENTCYRMQWGSAHRCEGWRSRADEETVDGQVKCEKWIRDDGVHSEETKSSWWLNRLIGRTKKVTFDWPFPFAEDKLFVLTLSSGLEGYHVNVDGRHVTSFPYRMGFALEDATGLTINGDIDVHSVLAGSLPTSHPSYAPQGHLDMSPEWKAPPRLPIGHIEMFIGILSAGNHFAERMAVRKSWMQTHLIKSSKVVARFFVALHPRKEMNIELKKEADYFGDIVIVPYMDSYDLVVLKTVAIAEYGVRQIAAKFIMKCDDDTFVRVETILKEAKKIPEDRSFYIGNINYYHKPLRSGKWAVTYEEWPEEQYPPYANGPGYIVSSDIANFVVSEFEKHTLRLFKMEDVSMGMWVEQFNSSRKVEYVHSLKYCQHGCIEEYYTAHYQSPRQMLCLWNKLQFHKKPLCCNMR